MEKSREQVWAGWQKRRAKILGLGKLSAILFLFSFLALLDGVQMLLRSSANELTLLAGGSTGISGPCPFQNPVKSDLVLRFDPANAPLQFQLEGFFAGYLMGNGMWRGELCALEGAEGKYRLRVAFKGMEESGQEFFVHIYANADSFAAASP
ncbi:MAG: hypothetical protein IK079_03480, partial [Desulfovibrio sp.]|nr:hypothetical protein [Desulfovibrio sp.]